MNSRTIGGMLLIIGTSVGGGMLALPIATAPGGFFGSAIGLIFAWLIMTGGALLILEVNAWLPEGNNIISMARQTLGRWGEVFAWVVYLLLLYTLLSAYTASGADVLHGLIEQLGVNLPNWLGAIIFIVIFASIVILGIRAVDFANRGLMFGKLAVYVLLVLFTIPFVHLNLLAAAHPKRVLGAITVIITSYGFATIVPSLRMYFHNNIKQLRLVIIVGSLIPLGCYLIWVAVILGTLPLHGPNGLIPMLTSPHPVSDLAHALSAHTRSAWITGFADIFTSICVMTSFIAVSLGLCDFLADGFNVNKQGKGGFLVYSVAFVPPLAIVIFYPQAFLIGLSYAGIFCVLLLVLLPAFMAWSGRYRKNIAKGYQLIGGKLTLILLIIVGFGIIGLTSG